MARGSGSSKAGIGMGATKMGGAGKKPMPPAFMPRASKTPPTPMLGGSPVDPPNGYKRGGVVKGKKK